jgi:predicted phosphoadenosine phosphosulfate sulfurtransferase
VDVTAKVARLREILGTVDSALIAFSGGVDSSFLLHEAAAVLARPLPRAHDRVADHARGRSGRRRPASRTRSA